jgi:hypothetical protein
MNAFRCLMTVQDPGFCLDLRRSADIADDHGGGHHCLATETFYVLREPDQSLSFA